MKKTFLTLIITIAVLAVLPLPLAVFVDLTFHWLLIVTIPAGGILIALLSIIWAILKQREDKKKGKK